MEYVFPLKGRVYSPLTGFVKVLANHPDTRPCLSQTPCHSGRGRQTRNPTPWPLTRLRLCIALYNFFNPFFVWFSKFFIGFVYNPLIVFLLSKSFFKMFSKRIWVFWTSDSDSSWKTMYIAGWKRLETHMLVEKTPNLCFCLLTWSGGYKGV